MRDELKQSVLVLFLVIAGSMASWGQGNRNSMLRVGGSASNSVIQMKIPWCPSVDLSLPAGLTLERHEGPDFVLWEGKWRPDDSKLLIYVGSFPDPRHPKWAVHKRSIKSNHVVDRYVWASRMAGRMIYFRELLSSSVEGGLEPQLTHRWRTGKGDEPPSPVPPGVPNVLMPKCPYGTTIHFMVKGTRKQSVESIWRMVNRSIIGTEVLRGGQ